MAWQFSPGEILTAANLNAVTRPWNALCQVRMAAPLSITNNTSTAVTFDTEDLDPLGWHSTGSNTERITPTIAGWYEVFFTGVWAGDTDYTRVALELYKNTASLTPLAKSDLAATDASDFVPRGMTGTSGLVSLNGSTDYIRLVAFQTNTSAGADTVDALLYVKLVYPT